MPLAVILSPINPLCPDGVNQCNGSINAAVTGNTGAPTFVYYKNGVPFSTQQNISNLCAGNYRVVVNDSVSLSGGYAPATASVDLTAPAAINPNAIFNNAFCYIAGSITLFPTGGTSPYTYLWSTGATSNEIDGLSAGTYSVTITDSKGCSSTFSFVIGGFDPFTVFIEAKLEKCFEGNIDLTSILSNGTAPYTYLWNTGETTATIQATAGTSYGVTVTDANGCTATTNITIPTQVKSYLCCLADKISKYIQKLKDGVKVCKCERKKYLVLSILIKVYDRMTTPIRVAPAISDQEQLINDTFFVFGDSADFHLVAQSFVPAIDNIVSIDIIPNSSGTYLHDVTLSIYDDLSGVPNVSLCSTLIPNATWNANLFSVLNVKLPVTNLVIGKTYWIVLSSSVLVSFGRPSISTQGTGTYGVMKGNGGGSWGGATGESMYFQEYGYGSFVPDCLTLQQTQSIKEQLTKQCGCCNGCNDLPQQVISN